MYSKRIFVILFFVFAYTFTKATNLKSIHGKVIEEKTGTPLNGALIAINDLKLSTSTTVDGVFNFKNLPNKGKFIFEISHVGYKTEQFLVDLALTKDLVFKLSESIIEAEEVVITGTPFGTNQRTSSLAVSVLSRDALLASGSSNLINAVANLPGVSSVSTGVSVAKPVIRGLGFNRVLTMIDGVREEGQQWGDEHGVLVDEFSAAKIEVLKGPASLLYGSDALGGVINIIDDLVPAIGKYEGTVNLGYQSNNGLFASSLMGQGNTNGFVYRARMSYKNAAGFASSKYVVPNSGFNENSISTLLGLRKKWGYSNLYLSRLSTNVGLVEDGPDANGSFIDALGNIISEGEANKRELGLPQQHIEHYRAVLRSNLIVKQSQIKTDFGFQYNLRQEFEEDIEKPSMSLALNTFTYDIKYALNSINKLETSVGVQGMLQQNINKAEELLIPDYNSTSIGAFIYMKKNFLRGALNAGLRYDHRTLNGKNMYVEENGIKSQYFTAFNNSFSNWSSSLGFAYPIGENINLKGNIGTGFRAPNIAELSSKGKHEGTFRYEIGNSSLNQESSLQFDMGISYKLKNMSIELSTFYNNIYNYIYLRQQNNETIALINSSGQTEVLPVYRFAQTNANLMGAELNLDIHLIEPLHLESSFSYVKGENKSSGGSLPMIAPAQFNNEIQYFQQDGLLKGAYVKFGVKHSFAQNKIDNFETPNLAYTLFDLGLGANIFPKSKPIQFSISVQNLTNVSYFSHLSRYKLVNIYNPGRNISFGLKIAL